MRKCYDSYTHYYGYRRQTITPAAAPKTNLTRALDFGHRCDVSACGVAVVAAAAAAAVLRLGGRWLHSVWSAAAGRPLCSRLHQPAAVPALITPFPFDQSILTITAPREPLLSVSGTSGARTLHSAAGGSARSGR